MNCSSHLTAQTTSKNERNLCQFIFKRIERKIRRKEKRKKAEEKVEKTKQTVDVPEAMLSWITWVFIFIDSSSMIMCAEASGVEVNVKR